jgi:cystathionine beta-lyase
MPFYDVAGTVHQSLSSGMSALMCVTRLVKTGERIVTGEDIYGGTSRLLGQVVPKIGTCPSP